MGEYPAHGRQHGLRAQLAVVSLSATGTSLRTALGGRGGEAQEFGQSSGSGPMHRRAHRHLHRLQVEPSALALGAENHRQELLYFACDRLLDRFRRFFSAAFNSSSPSTGRNWQIFSFTSTKLALSA